MGKKWLISWSDVFKFYVLLPFKSQVVVSSSTEFEGFVPSGCNIVGVGWCDGLQPGWSVGPSVVKLKNIFMIYDSFRGNLGSSPACRRFYA